MSVNIIAPAAVVSGVMYPVSIIQQYQGPLTNGLACVQFSNSADGPWLTARPDTGAVRSDPIPWSKDEEELTAEAKSFENASIRLGIWPLGADIFSDPPSETSDDIQRVTVISGQRAT